MAPLEHPLLAATKERGALLGAGLQFLVIELHGVAKLGVAKLSVAELGVAKRSMWQPALIRQRGQAQMQWRRPRPCGRAALLGAAKLGVAELSVAKLGVANGGRTT